MYAADEDPLVARIRHLEHIVHEQRKELDFFRASTSSSSQAPRRTSLSSSFSANLYSVDGGASQKPRVMAMTPLSETNSAQAVGKVRITIGQIIRKAKTFRPRTALSLYLRNRQPAVLRAHLLASGSRRTLIHLTICMGPAIIHLRKCRWRRRLTSGR